MGGEPTYDPKLGYIGEEFVYNGLRKKVPLKAANSRCYPCLVLEVVGNKTVWVILFTRRLL